MWGFLGQALIGLEPRRYCEHITITQRGFVMKLGPGLTFSWKRALGITDAKRMISKKTGIPLSRSGRRSKLGRILGMK